MTDGRLNDLGSIRRIEAPFHEAPNGDLSVFEGGAAVPFTIARVFVVRAGVGAVRGMHAHRECAQLMTCPSGSIEVECDDGVAKETFVLDRPNVALLVPAGIWAQETYREPHSVLTVLCDRPYVADDYIRNYDDFKSYRQGGAR